MLLLLLPPAGPAPPSSPPAAIDLSTWLLLVTQGGPAPTPPDLPASLMGAIIGRFDATPALVSAVPGRLNPGLPPPEKRVPWATIVDIGSREVASCTGADGASIWEHRFQIGITAASVTTLHEVLELFYASFNYKVIPDNPLVFAAGRAISARPVNSRMSPAPEPGKAGVLRQLTFTLECLVVRMF